MQQLLSSSVKRLLLDKFGLHRMENPSHSDVSVELHVYFPPFDHCQVFDERIPVRLEAEARLGCVIWFSRCALLNC